MALWPAGPGDPVAAGESAPRTAPGAEHSPVLASPEWSPPEVEPFPRVPAHASPKKPRFIPSKNAIATTEQRAPYLALAPPGPRARFEAIQEQLLDDPPAWKEAYDRKKTDLYAVMAHPQMRNLALLGGHVATYRLGAMYAGADELAAALFERELQLKGLKSDGEVPPEHVQDQACAWVGVAEACELPDYVGCSAARELDALATAICEDPNTVFDEEVLRNGNLMIFWVSGAE